MIHHPNCKLLRARDVARRYYHGAITCKHGESICPQCDTCECKSYRRKWRLRFVWYDMWVGAYWDSTYQTLYICPIPMVVISVRRLEKKQPKIFRKRS